MIFEPKGKPIILHKPTNLWVAYGGGGVPLGTVDAEILARTLEEAARAIRAGSDAMPFYPPKIEWGGIPCTFRRSNVPRLDPVSAGASIT